MTHDEFRRGNKPTRITVTGNGEWFSMSNELVPVVHARWIQRVIEFTDYISAERISVQINKCSKCGTSIKAYEEFAYCPHCGAKMDLPTKYEEEETE